MTPESKKLLSQFACALSNETIYGEGDHASLKRCREYSDKTKAAREALEAYIEQIESASAAGAGSAQQGEQKDFEAWARKDIGMPDRVPFNWETEWVKAALDGWQARAAIAQQAAPEAPATTASAAYEMPVLNKGTREQQLEAVARGGIDDLMRLHAALGFSEDETIDADKMIERIVTLTPSRAADGQQGASRAVLDGCLADRLYEAIGIARDRAVHAGSTPRRKKWEATAADLRAALARAPLSGQGATHWKAFIDNWMGEYDVVLKNAAYHAILSVSPLPTLTVWSGPMPESNGRHNYTAVLHRKDSEGLDRFTDGFQFARGEHPDRVRYEADFMRWLIGERDTKPELWDDCYDMDKHSGYKAPVKAVDDARDAALPAEPTPEIVAAMKVAWWKGTSAHVMKTTDAYRVYFAILSASRPDDKGEKN